MDHKEEIIKLLKIIDGISTVYGTDHEKYEGFYDSIFDFYTDEWDFMHYCVEKYAETQGIEYDEVEDKYYIKKETAI